MVINECFVCNIEKIVIRATFCFVSKPLQIVIVNTRRALMCAYYRCDIEDLFSFSIAKLMHITHHVVVTHLVMSSLARLAGPGT